MNIYEIYRSLGCSARLYEYNSCFRRIEHPSVHFTEREINATDTEYTIHTAVGNQTVINRKSVNSPHPITLKWEVDTLDELKVAAWREENVIWEWDQGQYEKLQGIIGDLGAPTMFMPRMNVQCLYIEKMGVEKGINALFNHPQEIVCFFTALEESHLRLMDVINESPIDIINFGENIHAGTLSPSLFLQYHLPECQRRCDKLHSAGKFVSSHWDGDTKPLLPFVKETGLDAVEAITPSPQGDVSLQEIKSFLGDDIFLIDGIPAIYFDETFSEHILIECTGQIIDMFAPKLILGISDEISSSGDIERIRLVGDIVDNYNSQFK